MPMLAPTVRRLVLCLAVVASVRGLAAGAAATAGDQPRPVADVVQGFAADVDAYWVREFALAGRGYTGARARIFGHAVETGCGHATSGESAFYCDQDHTIYLAERFLSTVIRPFGDFAIAQVVAHEWGHHVQAQLGRLDRTGDGRPGHTTNTYNSTVELQADCLAGTYARDAVHRHRAAPRDVDQAISVLAERGGDPSWVSQGSENAHGTSAQRVRLFLQGYFVGDGLTGCGNLSPAA